MSNGNRETEQNWEPTRDYPAENSFQANLPLTAELDACIIECGFC